ncbi:PASTA domain-containing protein [Streptomyces sp. NPDC050704]|uniref:PASTA domain-containing protein n=1 Tax=Streptomyces sp. NPDC050704 TaxID=3157219 RepID=UPI00341ECE9A
MRTRTATAALVTAGLLALIGCGSGVDTAGTADTAVDKPTAVQDADDTSASAGDKAEPGGTDAETAGLPNMVGKGLQSAQDQAQEAGFYGLTSHDALGRGRMQAFDRNWKVCGQVPRAGEHPTDTEVDFAAVKLEEDCPAKDAGEPEQAGATMPDFEGKSVKAARQALDSGTGITVHDASGQDRFVLMESNWQVCSQEPAAGSTLDGRPVTLDAVKFEESC